MMYVPSIFDNSTWDNFFGDDFFRAPAGNAIRTMRTDVKKADGKYELDVELPGFKKEDVTLSLENGYLKISATQNTEDGEKDDDGKWVRRERYTGSAERSFYVGDQLTEEDVQARFEDGILKISIPDEEAQKRVPEKKFISIEG